MMLFQIENQYIYELKISEPQVYQCKESHLEDLEELNPQKMSRLLC